MAALPGWEKQRRMIVGVYPSQVDPSWVTLSLAVYGVLSQEARPHNPNPAQPYPQPYPYPY